VSALIEAKRKMAAMGPKAQEIVNSKDYSNATKMKMLDALQAEMKGISETIRIHDEAGILAGGGNSASYAGEGLGLRAGRIGSPSIALDPDMQQGLYMAAKSGQNLRLELKDATSSDATRTQLPAQYIGLVDKRFEPTRILDHIPKSSMAGPSIEFITHTANTVGIGAPVISLGTAASGGTFAAGTYFWKLTATNGAGETLGSNEITATLTASQKQPINWSAVAGANGYRLYRGTAAGAENVLVAVIPGGATVTYADLGAAGTNASVPTVDRSASAATVHAGAAYPETSLTTVATILVAKKLGIFSTVVDELFADFPTFSQYLDVELQRQITDAENWQLLNGDGTGDNLLGLLSVAGTLSRVLAGAGTTAALDTLEQGITDLRNGPSFCEPDAIIIHPSTWSNIRRTKDSQNRYLLGNPGETTVSDVWGIPVLQTTQIVPGTVVMANLELATQAFIREGITLNMTNSSDDDFTKGKVKIRSSERLTLGVSRPTAINVLTGF
jgi:hypothetical protein